MIRNIILALGVLSLVNAPDSTPVEERKHELFTFFNVDDTPRAESFELPMIGEDTAVSIDFYGRGPGLIDGLSFQFTLPDATRGCIQVSIKKHRFKAGTRGLTLNGDELKRILYQCAQQSRDIKVSIVKLDPALFSREAIPRDRFMFRQSVSKPTSVEQIAEAFGRCEDYLRRRNIALQYVPMAHRDVKIKISGLGGSVCELNLNSERTVEECEAKIAEIYPQTSITSINLVLDDKQLTYPRAQIRELLSDDRQDVLSLNLVIGEVDPLAALMSDDRIALYHILGAKIENTGNTLPLFGRSIITDIRKIALRDPDSGQDIAGFSLHIPFVNHQLRMPILSKLKEALVCIQEGTVPTHRDIALSSPWQITRSENSLCLVHDLALAYMHIEFFAMPDSDKFAEYADYITHAVFPYLARVWEEGQRR